MKDKVLCINDINLTRGGIYVYPQKKERNSNLELYRIIIMLLIVAHHYVVNSGLGECISQNPLSANSLFYLLFGAWGKTGINCFVLITGYFMCKTEITLRKFLKLFLWMITYSIIISLIFTVCGYHPDGLLKMWINTIPLLNITKDFTSCFLMFYLCIPFLNILIRNLTKQLHCWIIILLLFIYTLHGSIPYLSVSTNYVSWFATLYFISSYLRLYPMKRDGDTRFWGWMTAISWGISAISVISCHYLQYRLTGSVKIGYSFYFIRESNVILALTNGITSFMWFKNLKIKSSKIINTIASSSFGVFLIHTNSDTMRQWLWKDTIDCVGHYNGDFYWAYAMVCVIVIYAVCTIIDIIRVKTIETPLLNATECLCHNFWKSVKLKYSI